ncbi:conserved hypothetical protein [Candidatus Roizmanbacteria bacterium]|nr:conserved hypothetical protein [Candidatus Roizmanbacteria bacterium]
MLTKKDILSEIQKLTKENGGKTPGAKKFEEITGIGPYDLRKHSWSNYGELVHEAGLTPNKFDNTKYGHEQLCKIFIEVIREKGKWPTRAVLDVKRYNNSKFPASRTFYKKLGLTGNLAQSILEYIKDQQGFEDIVDICNTVLEKYKNENKTEEENTEKKTHGWVYLIKHGSYNQYRIGKATNLLRRLGQNRIELPEKITPVHSIETVDITGVETYWLNRFKSKRLNGDWFNLSRSDVKEFKAWKRIV